jgi:hypothetical protein
MELADILLSTAWPILICSKTGEGKSLHLKVHITIIQLNFQHQKLGMEAGYRNRPTLIKRLLSE